MKQYQYKISGISQDAAYQVFNPEKAYSCQNIRFFTSTDSMSLIAISNERGNTNVRNLKLELASLLEIEDSNTISFNLYGVCEIPDGYLVFASYNLTRDTSSHDVIFSQTGIIYTGNDFNFCNEVQSICIQENDSLIKVYFIDGYNTAKVINITEVVNNGGVADVRNKKYEFLPDYHAGTVTVETSLGGRFHSGVIQYAFTYLNESMQETNIWHITPLYYVNNNGKSADAETICNTAFKIKIEDADDSYEYIRVYGILRTSKDAEPTVYTLEDIKITDGDISFIDTGSEWISYNAMELVQKQKDRFIAKYISSTCNRLFMGNFKLKSEDINLTDNDVIAYLNTVKNSLSIEFSDIDDEDTSIRKNLTFRSNEWYRIGIQFTNDYGSVSDVIYLDDILMDTLDPVSMKLKLKRIKAHLPEYALGFGTYTKARLMMVDRTFLPRRSLCQGVLCPTLYRLQDRVDNLPFSISSWSMRGITIGYPYSQRTVLPTSGADEPLNPSWCLQGGELQSQNTYTRISSADYSDLSNPLPPMLVRDSQYSGSGGYYLAMIYYNYVEAPADRPVWYSSSIIYRIYESDSDNTDITDNQVIAEITLPCSDYLGTYTDMQTLGGLVDDFKDRMYDYAVANNLFYSPKRLIDTLAMQFAINYTAPNAMTENYATTALTDLSWSSLASSPVPDGSLFMTIDKAHTAASLVSGKPFICDHNLVTFHSPDVEKYGGIIDNNPNIKYRVIGYSKMFNHTFDYHINASTPNIIADTNGVQSVSKYGEHSYYNAYLWGDGRTYPVYIWNKTNSLAGQQIPDNGVWYGQVSTKIMCNKHYCNEVTGFSKRENVDDVPIYFTGTDTVDAYYNSEPVFPKIGTPRYFNSNEVIGLSVEKQKNSLSIYNNEVYQGNVDILHSSAFVIPVKSTNSNEITGLQVGGNTITSVDPIWIRYKSTPHIVLPMSYVRYTYTDSQDNIVEERFAPSLPSYKGTSANIPTNHAGYMWCNNVHGFLRSQIGYYIEGEDMLSGITDDDNPEILYVAELYLDLSADDIYPDEDSSSAVWIPISDWGDLFTGNEGIDLIGYGDTYLSNWDCLKTYAYSEDDVQQYKDVTNITLESDTNSNGRYDTYKDSDSVLHASNINFNLFNDVYNQKDNLFSYRNTDSKLKSFTTQLFYSEVKTFGEKIDSWCKISPVSTMDVEGINGPITGLVSNNQSIYVFQENAISKVSSNTRVAVSTSDGMPISIGNNGQVDTPKLISENYGVKDVIYTGVSNDTIYFINNNASYDLASIGREDNITNISIAKGMHTYTSNRYNITPLMNNDPLKLLIDETNGDVYMQFVDTSLAYNNILDSFTSFYSYEKYKYVMQYEHCAYGITNDSVWKQRSGDYNNFFEEYQKYGIELIVNSDPLSVKTFTNVEYNMDSSVPVYDGSTNTYHYVDSHNTFNYIEVEDSYQKGWENITRNVYNPSFLKRKLRTWRINIPRNRNSLDRITDTWCKVKLYHNPVSTGDTSTNKIKSKVNYINVVCYPK